MAISPLVYLSAGLATFAGTHLIMSEESNRIQIKKYLGNDDDKFKGFYSAVSLAIFIPTVWVYVARARKDPVGGRIIWQIKNRYGRLAVDGTLKPIAAFGLSQAIVEPATTKSFLKLPENLHPDTFVDELGVPTVDHLLRLNPVLGVHRITRHPMFMSLSLWAISNILVKCTPARLIFWGFFPVFTVIGSWHQDTRMRKVLEARYFESTSFFPFGLYFEGKASLLQLTSELKWEVGRLSAISSLLYVYFMPSSLL